MAITEVLYDRKEQLAMIEGALLPGEHVEAVFDTKGGGTGFLGITTKRVIVYDTAFFRKMKAVVSIPLQPRPHRRHQGRVGSVQRARLLCQQPHDAHDVAWGVRARVSRCRQGTRRPQPDRGSPGVSRP